MVGFVRLGRVFGRSTSLAQCYAAELSVKLELPIVTVKVLPTEYCPPAAIGLMCDAARVVAAYFAHRQAFGQDRGEVNHRPEINKCNRTAPFHQSTIPIHHIAAARIVRI